MESYYQQRESRGSLLGDSCWVCGDLAEGHLIVLNVHSDNEKSLEQHCEVDKRRYEEN